MRSYWKDRMRTFIIEVPAGNVSEKNEQKAQNLEVLLNEKQK